MDVRNATASWSGYFHQGKIGVFLLLERLLTLLEENEDYKGWYVEYESAEDIDVKKPSMNGSEDEVVSRHQVKAYLKGSTPNKYKDVLSVFKYKYSDGKLSIETPGFQIHNYDEEGNQTSSVPVVDSESRYLHTIKEVKGFGLNENDLKEFDGRQTYVSNPNNVKLFEYPDGNKYCSLSNGDIEDDIHEFCINKIEKILKIRNFNLSGDLVRIKKVYLYVLAKLDLEIREKHKYKGFPTLFFEEVLQIIEDQSDFEETRIRNLRVFLVKQWAIFLEELYELEYEEEDDTSIKIFNEKAVFFKKKIDEIYQLNDENLLDFFRKMNPDKFNEDEEQEFLSLCDDNSFKDVFLSCLVGVTEKEFDCLYNGYRSNGGFLVSQINRKPAMVSSVIQRMMDNRGATKDIFQRDYLVNAQIENIKISEKIDLLVENKPNVWGKRASENDKFTNSNMSFIRVDDAIAKINSEVEND